ncbi:unnamed protein product [Protopolystoma xenopodis]|uniref:Uncharacterized protein n=1 Tax=Protopolystoma xenopodis TaxID=117903 RepID=A0A448WGV6_9PLAT|nr:unnamed protein product [Protopolystoma xenopodis]
MRPVLCEALPTRHELGELSKPSVKPATSVDLQSQTERSNDPLLLLPSSGTMRNKQTKAGTPFTILEGSTASCSSTDTKCNISASITTNSSAVSSLPEIAVTTTTNSNNANNLASVFSPPGPEINQSNSAILKSGSLARCLSQIEGVNSFPGQAPYAASCSISGHTSLGMFKQMNAISTGGICSGTSSSAIYSVGGKPTTTGPNNSALSDLSKILVVSEHLHHQQQKQQQLMKRNTSSIKTTTASTKTAPTTALSNVSLTPQTSSMPGVSCPQSDATSDPVIMSSGGGVYIHPHSYASSKAKTMTSSATDTSRRVMGTGAERIRAEETAHLAGRAHALIAANQPVAALELVSVNLTNSFDHYTFYR